MMIRKNQSEITFDEALWIVKTKHIVYASDATMQAMLSDTQGRMLIVEPGIGYREEDAFSIFWNVRQESIWASRVSFVYSEKEHTVFCVENNHFDEVVLYKFD